MKSGNDIGCPGNEPADDRRDVVVVTVGGTVLDDNVCAIVMAERAQVLPERLGRFLHDRSVQEGVPSD